MNKLLALAQAKISCGYVFGSQGEIMTKERLAQLIGTHGRSHYYFKGYSAEKWIGKQCFDCSGLIVWCLQQLGLISKGLDYTAAALYSKLCSPALKADLRPGDLVFVKGSSGISHVGIYASENQVVEAKGTKYGVVKSTIRSDFNTFGRLRFALDELTGMDILKRMGDAGMIDSKNWRKAIDAIRNNSSITGDLEILKYLEDLIEKTYKFAKG